MVDISDEERNLFFQEVNQVAKVLHKLYQPDKVNYGAYGDGGSHLHFHLVPKYNNEFEWGTPFAMNPDQTYLADEEYEAMAEDIRRELGVLGIIKWRCKRPAWVIKPRLVLLGVADSLPRANQ